ncbi:MAG TPA: DNA-3-methyladenine glycosylase I [Phycisphaerales bacterium]|nr:DNA-3-methyladenine glycosylase I [Phycisphaerales bacterium]|tara:strand:+ start:155 stop:721 length:567 start_codon:yes stop_codon:yes gene_type:complete
MTTPICRCVWAKDPLEIVYHDTEWGVPVHDDNRLYEKITLEGAQAGLSWLTILKKREGYRKLFKQFDPRKVSKFTAKDVERLMLDPSIVRNRLKVESTINNAKAVLKIQKEFGSLDTYLWQFVDGKTIVNHYKTMKDLPAQTPLSKTMSKDMLKRGFRFVGPTTMYALMQSVGMVNDHVVTCFRHSQV